MNRKGSLSLPLIFIVIALIVGAYYLGTQKTNIVSLTGDDQKTNTMPNNWISKTSTQCGVVFQVPPNEEPYFEYIDENSSDSQNRRFWQFREGDQASDGHTIFKKGSSAMYVADIEASGYIAGLIEVQCAPNSSYTLDTIAENFAAGFGANAGIKVKNKRVAKLWGTDVVAATYEGGMFSDNEIYFIMTDENVYKVTKRSDSDKELVINTMNQIFNNLQFSK